MGPDAVQRPAATPTDPACQLRRWPGGQAARQFGSQAARQAGITSAVLELRC